MIDHALLRHSDDPQIRLLRRNRIQGNVVLIDFLQTDVMRRNFPTLCPAVTVGYGTRCMTKKRFAFRTVTGTNHLKGDPAFTLGHLALMRSSGIKGLIPVPSTS